MDQFKKNFIWNILGTGFSAFNSLFFMITVTRINGVENAGIFTIAFSTACILYVVGVYAGRIYQVTEPDKSITNKEYIINKLISTVLMLILVVIFCAIKGYTIFKTIVFILLTGYKALEAFSEVLYGILQKNEKLDKVGKSLLLKALISIVLFILADVLTKNLIISIVFILVTNIAVIALYDLKNVIGYIEKKSKVNQKHILNIFKLGFFTFIITFLGVYISNAPKYAIDKYLEENYQTIFGIIVMPATVMTLVSQFIIHPYLNKIVEAYERRDIKELHKIAFKLISIIVLAGILASILAYFLGPEVLGIVYGLDLTLYRTNLLIIIIASTLYTIGVVYSSVLTTVRDTFSQFIIYIIVSIFALCASNILTEEKQVDGAIYAYLGTMALQFMIYTIYANIKLNKIFKLRQKTNGEINQ